MSGRTTRVLVVDDSALVRQTLLSLLEEQGGFEVAVAADPLIAMQRIARRRPDVIVLDIEMPRMDGLTFLRRQMADDPIPVVVCSAFAAAAGRAAIEALEAGAVDVVTKPVIGVRGFLEEQIVAIVDVIQAAARARLPGRARPEPASPEGHGGAGQATAAGERRPSPLVVAIGASTGGTQALRTLLAAMPADAPAFLVTQHMPAGFTRAFAERLDHDCVLEVREAAAGDRVLAGRVLVAPGDRHMRLQCDRHGYLVALEAGPLVSRHRPSVDVLFHSVAQAARDRAVGVILTGMGDDGADGLGAMQRAGAATLAQDEASSVVFGMPKEAIRRGAAMQVVALPDMASAILALASGGRRRRELEAADAG